MIKTVVFDIDNTLYSYDNAHKIAYSRLLDYAEKELFIPAEEFDELHRSTNKELIDYMGSVAATHNRLIRYQNILEKKGLPLYPHALRMYHIYWDTLIEEAVPSAGAVDTLRQLKEAGIRIGIGTDMTAYMQHIKLEKLDMLQYIDFMVSSEETTLEKPTERFFDRCLKKAGCSKEECIFVGDHLKKDAIGACEYGFRGIWYHSSEVNDSPQIEFITDIRQLLDII